MDRDTVISVIVTIFVVIGWFVKIVLAARQEEEPSLRRPKPDPRGNRPRPPQPGRAKSEAERVWEEMLRKRRQAEERQEKPPAPKRVAAPYARAPEPTPKEKRAVVKPGRIPSRPPSPSPAPGSQRVERGPAVQEVVVAEVVEEAFVPTQVVVGRDREPGKRRARASITVAGQKKTASPTLVQLAKLLRTPQTLQTAMVLREIFDAPLSHRRSRHRSR